jgi:hypothetical protein
MLSSLLAAPHAHVNLSPLPRTKQPLQQIQPTKRETHLQHPPAVVSRLLSDHQLTAGDALGRHRLLGSGDRRAPPGAVYGAPSAREPEPCVAELILCGYSEAQQRPDADLGKTLREGWRASATASATASAAAGAGAARCARTEVAQLLAPPRSAELGVGAPEMAARRGRDEMAALAAAGGLVVGPEEFDEIFDDAAALEGGGEGGCSLEGFLEARQQRLRHQLGV